MTPRRAGRPADHHPRELLTVRHPDSIESRGRASEGTDTRPPAADLLTIESQTASQADTLTASRETITPAGELADLLTITPASC